jgi:hypothetical protein
MAKLLTEDLGKQLEMGVCLAVNTPYNGPYKYGMDVPEALKPRLMILNNLHPGITHTAENGSRYDFGEKHLSAKTSKRDGMVCPQVIGQPTKKKFCQYFKLPEGSTNDVIKEYIVANYRDMLIEYWNFTFDCPTIYYNKKRNKLIYVTIKKDIEWWDFEYDFTHIINKKKWNESTTLKIGPVSIGEFQVHKHRNGVKFRWSFENLLKAFPDHFEVLEL